jgi:hypothetical protein
MRPKGQVAQKLKQAVHRAIQREVRNLTRRTASNCANNREVGFGPGSIRVCALDCQKCDPVLDDRAPECPDYASRASEQQIRKSLREFLKARPPQDLAARFPDVASLLWVLADEEGDDQRGHLMVQAEPALKLWDVVVWTDTPEDRQAIQEAYGEAVRVRGEQEELVAAQLSRIQDLQARQQELSDELGSLRQKSLQEAVGLKAAQARADKLQADLEEATQLLDIAKGSLEQKDGIISRQATALASSEKALRESEARVEEQRRLVQSKDEDLAILQGELEDARALRLPTHQDVPDSWWRRFLSWF